MSVIDILNYVLKHRLCKNWKLEDDDKTLYFFFNNYSVCFVYNNNYLYSIVEIEINNKYINDLKKILKNYGKIYYYNNKLYIQSKYKNFTKDIFKEEKYVYNDIMYFISLLQDPKKIAFIYPLDKNVNLEKDPKSNYPIISNELPLITNEKYQNN